MSASGVGCSRVFSDRLSLAPGCPLLLSLASLLPTYSFVGTHRRSWRLVPDRRTCDSSLRTRGAPVTTRLREERRVRARQVCLCCWCETGRPASVGRTHGAWRSFHCRRLPWQRQRRPNHTRRVFLTPQKNLKPPGRTRAPPVLNQSHSGPSTELLRYFGQSCSDWSWLQSELL